jgi:hypothetical protein
VYYTKLHCSVLRYLVLHCTALSCPVLYCAMMCALYYTVLYCSAHHSKSLHCFMTQCIALYSYHRGHITVTIIIIITTIATITVIITITTIIIIGITTIQLSSSLSSPSYTNHHCSVHIIHYYHSNRDLQEYRLTYAIGDFVPSTSITSKWRNVTHTGQG